MSLPGVEFSDWTALVTCRSAGISVTQTTGTEGKQDGLQGQRDLAIRRKRNGCHAGKNGRQRLEVLVLRQWGGWKDFSSETEQLGLDWGSGSGELRGAEKSVGICKSVPLRDPGGLGRKAWRAGVGAEGARLGCQAGTPHLLLQGLFQGPRPRHPLAMGLQMPARAWAEGPGSLPPRTP